MKEPTVFDWGQSPTLAPSIKRANPLGWIAASAFIGIVAGLISLLVTWRQFPGLAAPPGALPEHLNYASKLGFHALFNSFFVEDSRFYLRWLSDRSDAERVALIWRATLASWFFLMPWALLGPEYLRGRDALIHLRGSTRLSGAEAVAEINRRLAARVKRRPDHQIAPGVAYPSDLWTRHVLVVGGVGSGKSTAIKPLIDKVVAAGEQMMLFDPKSEFTMGFAAPELLAPWDARSLAWDIAKDMRNLLDMRRFAATMIKESQDPMWSNASRQLLVGLMIYLKSTRGSDWGWLELRELIALPQSKLLEIMKKWHPEAERAVEKASVTTAGILINLASFCSSIFDLAEAWGETPPARRVSFVEWIHGRSPHRQIILQGHGAYSELTKSYVEGIFGVVSAMVNSVEMTDDPNRKIWFIADEFSQMGKIPVRPLFEVGRSRGVRCVVACQDFAQLEEIHGASMVKALVGMCGTILVGQVMQGETAEALCKAFGAREVERANISSSSGAGGVGSGASTTLSYNRDEVPLYKPSELTSRLGLAEDGLGVVLLLFTGGQAYELRWPLYNVRFEREPHVPAPWTLGWAAPPDLAAANVPPDGVSLPEVASVKSLDHDAEREQGQGQGQGRACGLDQDSKLHRLGSDSTLAMAGAHRMGSPSVDGIGAASPDAKSGSDRKSAQPRRAVDGALAKPRGLDHGHDMPGRQWAASLEGGPPKEMIVVEAAQREAEANMEESPGDSSLSDATVELMASKAGLGPLGLAIEAVAAIEASASAANAPKQSVRMGPAPRTGTSGQRRGAN